MANYSMKHGIDIVFCVESSIEMSRHIDRIKKDMHKWCERIIHELEWKYQEIGELRTKLITFTNYDQNDREAILLTDFFVLPKDYDEFETCVNSFVLRDKSDKTVDGLEALAYAICSKWSNEWMKRRRIIIVYANSPTHSIGYHKNAEHYPKGMPKSMKEIASWWDELGWSKRLVLFTPYAPDWNIITQMWDNTIHFPSEAGEGINNEEIKELLTFMISPDI